MKLIQIYILVPDIPCFHVQIHVLWKILRKKERKLWDPRTTRNQRPIARCCVIFSGVNSVPSAFAVACPLGPVWGWQQQPQLSTRGLRLCNLPVIAPVPAQVVVTRKSPASRVGSSQELSGRLPHTVKTPS